MGQQGVNIGRWEALEPRHVADPSLPVGRAKPSLLQNERHDLLRQYVDGRRRWHDEQKKDPRYAGIYRDMPGYAGI